MNTPLEIFINSELERVGEMVIGPNGRNRRYIVSMNEPEHKAWLAALAEYRKKYPPYRK